MFMVGIISKKSFKVPNLYEQFNIKNKKMEDDFHCRKMSYGIWQMTSVHAAGLGTKATDRQPFKIHFLASKWLHSVIFVCERFCPKTHFLNFQLLLTIAVPKTSRMFIMAAVLKRIHSSRHFGI